MQFFGGLPEGGEEPLERWLVGHTTRKHLSISLAAERFASDSDPPVEFYDRETRKTRHFIDDAIPGGTVHVMTTGESFRLRISIQSAEGLCLPLEEVLSVHVRPPDGEFLPLKTWQRKQAHGLSVLALVDPLAFQSSRMKTACPSFGPADARYVRLTVRIRLRLGDAYPDEIPLFRDVHLQFKRPPTKLSFFRGNRASGENAVRQ